MIPPDEMNKWNEAIKAAEDRDRYRDELREARKCIADITAIIASGDTDTWTLTYIKERLDEYAGT
jgi:hypothetical protein